MNAKYRVHAGLDGKIDSSPTLRPSGFIPLSKEPL